MYNVWQTAKDDKTIRNRANEDLRIEQNLQEYMYHRLSVGNPFNLCRYASTATTL
jgi:hypothetical protein